MFTIVKSKHRISVDVFIYWMHAKPAGIVNHYSYIDYVRYSL